jgi:hypothetical protein
VGRDHEVERQVLAAQIGRDRLGQFGPVGDMVDRGIFACGVGDEQRDQRLVILQ